MKPTSWRTSEPIKTTVRVASVANIDLGAAPPTTIDGTTMATGDRVRLKEQTDPAENGIYDYGIGRSRDADQSFEGGLGQVVFAGEGDVNAGQGFVLTDQSPIRYEPLLARRTLFDSTADVSPSSADGTLHTLVTYSIPAGQLARNGDKLVGLWAGTYASGPSGRRVTLALAGTTVVESSVQAVGEGNWRIEATIVRVGATSAKVMALFGLGSSTVFGIAPQYATVTTNLDFAGPEDLVLEGSVSVGGANTDLVARFATVAWVAAAPT